MTLSTHNTCFSGLWLLICRWEDQNYRPPKLVHSNHLLVQGLEPFVTVKVSEAKRTRYGEMARLEEPISCGSV